RAPSSSPPPPPPPPPPPLPPQRRAAPPRPPAPAPPVTASRAAATRRAQRATRRRSTLLTLPLAARRSPLAQPLRRRRVAVDVALLLVASRASVRALLNSSRLVTPRSIDRR